MPAIQLFDLAAMSFSLPPRPGSLDIAVPAPKTVPDEPSGALSRPFGPVASLYNRFWSWRKGLELPNPGNAENMQKEVKCM
jgi:mitochondrial import receptor subunit TOM40